MGDGTLLDDRNRDFKVEAHRVTTNTEAINAIVRQLPEGDRHRVRLFAEAILQQRQGKREQRRSRFQKPSTPQGVSQVQW